MNRDLHRRLTRLETHHHREAPTAIFADRPLEDHEADALLANWRALVALGDATLSGNALVVIRPEPMTVAEWEATYSPPETIH